MARKEGHGLGRGALEHHAPVLRGSQCVGWLERVVVERESCSKGRVVLLLRRGRCMHAREPARHARACSRMSFEKSEKILAEGWWIVHTIAHARWSASWRNLDIRLCAVTAQQQQEEQQK